MNNIVEKINQLKNQKKAVILAHYYAPQEAQEIADYVGDSFYLAKVAKSTDADIVVFCGVGFMGESVKILNPEKTVLMPDISADCPMAHMAQIHRIKELKQQYPDLAVVCYINSTAELKQLSDVCVTSSNAVKIIKEIPNKNIFFIPDENLGRYVAQQVPDKNVILNDGRCPIHAQITKESVEKLKTMYPQALILTHPECTKEIVDMSDFVGSTSEIISCANTSDAKEFIICTESGVSYPLKKNNPEKKFYFPDTCPPCADMKLNTLEKILYVLETGNNSVSVPSNIRKEALLPLDKMLEIGK